MDLTAPTLPFSNAIDRSQRYANGLSRAATLHDADWLFAPTADDLLNHAMLRPFSISKLMPRKCQVECGIHYSTFRLGMPLKRMVLNLHKSLVANLIPNCHFHATDKYASDMVKRLRLMPAHRISEIPVLPLPAEFSSIPTKQECRSILKLPQDKRLIGIVGAISSHPKKGVPEVLATLKQMRNNEYAVVLAGKLSSELRLACYRDYERYIRSGSLFIADEFLSDRDMLLYLKAIDICSTVYREFYASSAMVVLATCLGTPFLSPKSAWFADFAKDYQSGALLSNKELTNVDVESIPITDYSGQKSGGRRKSLINYCSAENFSSLWSNRLAGYCASLDS